MDIFSQEGSMLLEEEIDESYEPTEEEILEYAKYLGMDIKKDKKYFNIAKEGLKAPLPNMWKPYKNSKGDIYYINMQTNQAVYEHPCDEYYRKLYIESKAKDNIAEKLKNNEKIITSKKNNKEEKIKPKIEKINTEESITNNQFQMLNDSFSDTSAKFTEMSNRTDNDNVSEIDLGMIDQEINNNIIKYKNEKESEFNGFLNNFEKIKENQRKKTQNNFDERLDEMRSNLKKLQDKLQNDTKKIEDNLKIGFQIKFDNKIKQETEKYNELKKILESKIKHNNKEAIDNFEDRCRNEMNLKKTKIYILKKEIEKDLLLKKKVIEKKKKFLLNKLMDEEKAEIERDLKENILTFKESELLKKKQKLSEFSSKLDSENSEFLYKLQKEENEVKNRNLLKKKEIKEAYLKRYEMEKQSESEKIKIILNQYEQDLKEKLKKKVDNVLVNKSIDIKIEKKRNRTTSNKKPQNILLESFEQINPMNLLDNFKEENLKEDKKTNVIESNDVQIKKIRNEINSLKNIINFSILNQYKNKEGGYLLVQPKEKEFKRMSFQKNSQNEKNKREWLTITIQERNFINNLKMKFKKIKQSLKLAQKNAIYEEKNLKKEMKKYLTMKETSQIKNKLLKEVKKKFLKNINQISVDIFSFREQEINLKTKENILMELENSYNKMCSKSSFDFAHLNEIYTKYNSVFINEEESLKILSIDKDSQKENSIDFGNVDEDEDSLLIENWNEIMKDYISNSSDHNETFGLKENNSNILFQLNRQNIEKRNLKSQTHKKYINKRNEISNSLHFLKNKFNENIQTHETTELNLERYSFQKNLIKCNENQDKVKKLFDNHSSWLKNMRNELNRTLYSKSMHISNISTERNLSFY